MEIPKKIIPINSHDALLDTLSQHSIAHQAWGENDTRTSHDLYKEIAEGEAALFLAEESLRRYCASVKVNLYHKTGSTVLRLVEAVQHNAMTGTWRHRGLYNSLSEKQHVFHGEGSQEAALRGMREELRGPNGEHMVTSPQHINLKMYKLWPVRQERNYEGLLSRTETHYYDALLRPEEYSPWGYIEQQLDESGKLKRATFFHWEAAKDGLPVEIDL
jgi:hypothetical protein